MKKIFFVLILVAFLLISFGISYSVSASPLAVVSCATAPSVPTFSGKDIVFRGAVNCTTTQPSISMSIATYGQDGYWYGGYSKTTYTNVKKASMAGAINHYNVTIPAQKYRTQVCGWIGSVVLPCTYSAWSTKYVP